jgi:hypothetical protein
MAGIAERTHAATVIVTGLDGANGANGVGEPGANGASGGDALAIALGLFPMSPSSILSGAQSGF